MLTTPWTPPSSQSCKFGIPAFVAMLGMASKDRDFVTGVRLHAELLKMVNLQSRSSVFDALIHMYASCGALSRALALVIGLFLQDAIPWTILISACVREGRPEDAMDCFTRMQHEGSSPDSVTFACVLKACGSTRAVGKGRKIHEEIVERGLIQSDVVLGTALIDMYCKCGALSQAQQVLEGLPETDLICWNALISGYAQHGQGQDALRLLETMQNQGFLPSVVTFTSALQACGSVGATDQGIKIHDRIVKEGLLNKHMVLGTALVDMYSRCGALARAHQVLEELSVRDVASWSALIAGYAEHNKGKLALICSEQMQREGLSPNAITLVSLLKACGSIGAGNNGEQIHNEIVKQGLQGNNIMIDNALVSMYAKCGALEKAQQIFEDLPSRNIVSWSTLIAGYVEQGLGNNALDTLKRMELEGVIPNAVTFTSILRVCSSFGCIEKGEELHNAIAKQGFLGADKILGDALVDMYARCGAVDRAEEVLKKLPGADIITWSSVLAGHARNAECAKAFTCFRQMQSKGIAPDTVTYTSLLNSCSLSGQVEVGKSLVPYLSSSKPDLEHYTCMVSTFAKAGHLDDAFAVTIEIPSFRDSCAQFALLDLCKKGGNINLGKIIFEQSNRWNSCHISNLH